MKRLLMRRPRFLSRLCRISGTVTLLQMAAWKAAAQWTVEEFPLQPGWNAIWLSIDCSHDDPGLILDNAAVQEVWRWDRSPSNAQFLESPSVPIESDSQWKVWKRGEPASTTLGYLTGNAGYLVRVEDGAAPFTLSLKGRPVAPRQAVSADGLNLIGFPIVPGATAPQQSLARFYGFSSDLKVNPPTYEYIGGPLSDTAPRNPSRVGSLTNTPVVRGRAYWVQTSSHAGYYGPLEVSLRRQSLDFGESLTTLSLRIRNAVDPSRTPQETVVATVAPLPSASPPVTSPPQESVAGPVPLKVRGAIDPVTGSFELTPLTGPVSYSLAPGEDREVVLVVDRQAMGNTAGQVFQSLLRITDSLDLTQIDLGVRAVSTSLEGVWVGEARISMVQQILGVPGDDPPNPPLTPVKESAEFPLRLILHRSASGTTALLQQVYLGNQITDDGVRIPVAGTTESALGTHAGEFPITPTSRLTSTHFHPSATPLAAAAAFGTGAEAVFTIELPYNHPHNPFVHAYHPDHDNLGQLNAVVPEVLPPNAESPTLVRSITLSFEPPPADLNDTTWGSTTLGGTYTEKISGLRRSPITVSGPFVLRRVSGAAALRLPSNP